MAPRRRLPPVNALRAFEAIGRHLSFAGAAEELGVTSSALSHHVSQLEALLQAKLLRREGRHIALTEEGRALLPGLSEGFSALARAVARFEARRGQGVLTVSTLSTFAMRWLLPRLPGFQRLHPHIDIRITTSVRLVDLEREGIDCAIRYGHGNWPGLTAERLFGEALVPVCSPALPTPERPLAVPADLGRHRLLHARLRPDDWRLWLHAVGIDAEWADEGSVFETRDFVIRAAVEGLGVAVVDPALVADELRSGRLIRPFTAEVAVPGAYYLVHPAAVPPSLRLAAFRGWLAAEAGVQQEPPAGP